MKSVWLPHHLDRFFSESFPLVSTLLTLESIWILCLASWIANFSVSKSFSYVKNQMNPSANDFLKNMEAFQIDTFRLLQFLKQFISYNCVQYLWAPLIYPFLISGLSWILNLEFKFLMVSNLAQKQGNFFTQFEKLLFYGRI